MSPIADDQRSLHAAMAGTGDPYAVLTPLRLRLLRDLLDQPSPADLAEMTGLTIAQTQAELASLVAGHLATRSGNRYRPAFVIVTGDEVGRVDDDACQAGRALAAALAERWSYLEEGYARLSVSRTVAFGDLAFFLLGDRILDVGLLDALASDGTLMPPAPHRPSPDHPDARYYFWMIEGNRALLGRYGQRATDLPWRPWTLLTFGQYPLSGMRNAERDALEAKARGMIDAGEMTSVESLTVALRVPRLGPEDVAVWSQLTASLSENLVDIYNARERELRALYASLRTARKLPEGFAEFFCWYDHVAYAHAIDALAERGLLPIPPSGFTAALWHETEPGGF